MFSVSLVIPMYNEEQFIARTLTTVSDFFNKNKYDYEIIVVDDGSTDASLGVVKKFLSNKIKLLQNPGNKGKGYAVRNGILNSSKNYVGFMDADMPYSLDGISNLFQYLKKYDISIGTRALPGSRVDAHPLWYRRVLGLIFCRLREFIINTGIRDTQCGAKCFRKNVARKIFTKQILSGFGFDVEILYLAKKYKFSVSEVPLHLLKEHSFKNSKLNPLTDPLKMFFDLFRIRFYNLVGKY